MALELFFLLSATDRASRMDLNDEVVGTSRIATTYFNMVRSAMLKKKKIQVP